MLEKLRRISKKQLEKIITLKKYHCVTSYSSNKRCNTCYSQCVKAGKFILDMFYTVFVWDMCIKKKWNGKGKLYVFSESSNKNSYWNLQENVMKLVKYKSCLRRQLVCFLNIYHLQLWSPWMIFTSNSWTSSSTS